MASVEGLRGWRCSRLAAHRRGRLRARPSLGGGRGGVRPGLTCAVPGPAECYPSWFAADPLGPRSCAPQILRPLVPDQALADGAGKTHSP
jgi:hypothetical protein